LRLRLVHLKNSINFFSYNSLKRIVDFAIFLTFFALVSSTISIFYEIKVNDISLKISQEQTKQRIYNSWVELISKNLHVSDRRYSQTADIINLVYGNYDDEIARNQMITFKIFQILNQMPTQLKNAAHDMRINFTDDQKKIHGIEELQKGYDDAVEILKSTDYFNPDANFSLLQKNLITSIRNTRNLLEKSLYIFNEVIYEVDKNIENLAKEKNNISRLSTNIILFSFVLQLLIFLIIQIIDIRSSEEV